MPEILKIVKPDNEAVAIPFVIDSPHSGDYYPRDFKPACDKNIISLTEDKYVDDLFSHAPRYGATLLYALFGRAYIDTNRAIDDIDPSLLSAPWPADHETLKEINPTARSAAGVGLIRRLVKPGIPLYGRDLSPAEIIARIEKYYMPYHMALAELLDDAHYRFGQVYHLNCHSMPSSSAVPTRPIGFIGNMPKTTDICLGDRDGTTAGYEFINEIRTCLTQLGYTVTINDPYKGVALIGGYAAPALGRHGVQMEINRALYIDEETGEKTKDYETLKSNMERLTSHMANYVASQLQNLAAD